MEVGKWKCLRLARMAAGRVGWPVQMDKDSVAPVSVAAVAAVARSQTADQ